MGASGWHYTVDYRDDINAALQQLRREVYERGEYYKQQPSEDLDMTEAEFRASLGEPDEDDDGRYEFIIEDWLDRKSRPVAVDPDTLLASQPESGTHSIIDMANGVSAEPRFATVSPLPVDGLVHTFGTATPSSEQVQAWIVNCGDRERWVGTYVVSFRDGTPDRLHFCGFSGD
ncbi:hypothetical protein ACQP00_24500 [Dactylosporangium sp. CS-047395]|uniref:hypothetical protein n=1 Tax=Dactylosporangium sp. CS-047395 TaxID=3239936 RepID=UPI003D8B26B7